jgi:hypothetical protein
MDQKVGSQVGASNVGPAQMSRCRRREAEPNPFGNGTHAERGKPDRSHKDGGQRPARVDPRASG